MNRIAEVVQDAGLGAEIAAAALASWILPERTWWPLTRAIGWAEVRLRLGRTGASPYPFDRALAVSVGRSPRSIAAERLASAHGARLWGLREYCRARRTHPVVVGGTVHLDHALAHGHGAILWVGRFAWATIITKVGLHQAGCPVTHLSRSEHGFGTSAFAIRRLNPIWTRIEERFLQDRLVMAPGSEMAALRALRRCLGANGLVSITVGDQGARSVMVPFLNGKLRLATGPLTLAAACGSPILPVFTVRENEETFLVQVEAPIEAGLNQDRKWREARMAEAYARRLESWVRNYPGQWLG
jgi:lauroyl/myristoyl acyltransferase